MKFIGGRVKSHWRFVVVAGTEVEEGGDAQLGQGWRHVATRVGRVLHAGEEEGQRQQQEQKGLT